MENIKKIVDFIKNGIDEENIDEIISVFTRKLSEDGKNADLYFDKISKKYVRNTIGFNQFGITTFGRKYSANSKFISDSIVINVSEGIGVADANLMVDETPEAYKILIEKIKNEQNVNFENLMKIVYDTTVEYFGTTENAIEEREDYYEANDVWSENGIGRISDFKGKNMAACVERAALSQNLMHFLGIDSTFKVAQIMNGEKNEIHAFNVVAFDGKYYLFDATIPNVRENGEITPIITEIPEEAYRKIIDPYHKDDVAIETEFDSIRGHKKIRYNSWSQNIIDTTKPQKEGALDENEGTSFGDDDAR